MGREIRRVPLDFNWPLNKVWGGFLNPFYKECPQTATGNCHGGSSAAAKWLDAIARHIALIGEEAAANTPEGREHMQRTRRTYPHPYLQEWGQSPLIPIPHEEIKRLRELPREQRFHELGQRTQEMVPLDAELALLVTGLANGKKLTGFGNSASYEIYQTLLRVAGLEGTEWGTCKVCQGHGLDPEVHQQYESWEKEPPPQGEGWQVWETVSEGSPVSPVFAKEEELVQYLVDKGYSRTAAENFCKDGWVPSAAMVDGQMYKDIEIAGIK